MIGYYEKNPIDYQFDQLQVSVQYSKSNLGNIKLNYIIDGEPCSKELSISKKPIENAVFYLHSSRLVMLLAQNELVISDLRVDPAKNIFEVKVVYKLAVPTGLNKYKYYRSDDTVLLYKLWNAEFNQQRKRLTQIFWIELRSGVRRTQFVAYSDLKVSARSGNQIFVHSVEPNGFDVFPIKT